MTVYLRCLGVLMGLPAMATAQFTWWQVATQGPSARFDHAMAFDSARGRTVMFGGRFYNAGYHDLGDTWEWNGAGWGQLASAGPAARANHAMVFDSARGRSVLFGGEDNATCFGDTWEWNGVTWVQVASTGPAARAGHAMAFDSLRGVTVLFGGACYNSSPNQLGDTWEWDGLAWTQFATLGPAARSDHAMAFDSARGETVLFGGEHLVGAALSYLSDTWEWNGSRWVQVANQMPYERIGHAMAYDDHHGKTVLRGGFVASGPNMYFMDTWEWDGRTWVQAANYSQGRFSHTMAYDSRLWRTVMFGGRGSATFGDTWTWSDGIYGTGCGSPDLALFQTPNGRPTPGWTATATLIRIPATIAFVSLGWSNLAMGSVPLPATLAGLGMPGCNLLQSADVATLPVTTSGLGTGNLSLPIPNRTSLLGLHVFLQGWAYAPGANPGQVIASNGLEWVIGY